MIFAAAIFTGAFLLFLVQPLIAKYILPWFGGGPGVWTACLLFFQCGLLAGYAYAHLLTRLRPRQQVGVHLALLAAALLSLPVTPGDQLRPSPEGEPTWQILLLLGRTVGLPYLALAATGPLLQAWFSRAHPARSPYRLYALSNIASLLALVGYPLVMETTLSRPEQTRWWSAGLALFALACAWCGWRVWRTRADGETGPAGGPPGPEPPPPRGRVWLWLALPACAAALLMATTNTICQNVAVVPFLWVLPLALYLLTFVVSFDSPRWYSRAWFGRALLLCWAGVYWVLGEGVHAPITLQVAVHAATLFVTGMICHGELYRLRPAPRQLTTYYLTIAAGGALGGLFVSLGAPVLFDSYRELHWILAASGGLFLAVCVAERSVALTIPLARRPARRGRLPAWIPLSLAVGALGWGLWQRTVEADAGAGPSLRNFYGVLTLFEYDTDDPPNHYRLLRDGHITHGLQYSEAEHARIPTTYYAENSGVGLAIRLAGAEGKRVGVVGLGTGTLAAYGRPGDHYRFYEINPAVVRLSGPAGETFTYLRDSEAAVEVALGDARLSMEREPPQRFDVLVLDAFSSDAIPVHLLTREAFQTYRRHLRPDGVIAVHVSNRYLDLQPVVLKAAAHLGMQALIVDAEAGDRNRWASNWVLVTGNQALVDHPDVQAARSAPKPRAGDLALWTDDYTSLVAILDDKVLETLRRFVSRLTAWGAEAG